MISCNEAVVLQKVNSHNVCSPNKLHAWFLSYIIQDIAIASCINVTCMHIHLNMACMVTKIMCNDTISAPACQLNTQLHA